MSISLREIPLAGKVGGDGLEVGGCVARQIARGVARGRLAGPGSSASSTSSPHTFSNGDAADEILDVDAAVAQCPTVAIGLGDLGLEGHDALEARLELAHRSPRSSTDGRHGRYLTGDGRPSPMLSSMDTVTLIPGDRTVSEPTQATHGVLGSATGVAIIEKPAAGAAPAGKESP